jgi:hypothetical protein
MQIDTEELIRKMRSAESELHSGNLKAEMDRHAKELDLIGAIELRFNIAAPDVFEAFKTVTEEIKQPSPGARVRDTATFPKARSGEVNVSAAAREWIAVRKATFTLKDITTALAKGLDIADITVRSRVNVFLSHLEETGQITVTGKPRSRIFTPTAEFKATKERIANSPKQSTPTSKEQAWRELRATMPQLQTEEGI